MHLASAWHCGKNHADTLALRRAQWVSLFDCTATHAYHTELEFGCDACPCARGGGARQHRLADLVAYASVVRCGGMFYSAPLHLRIGCSVCDGGCPKTHGLRYECRAGASVAVGCGLLHGRGAVCLLHELPGNALSLRRGVSPRAVSPPIEGARIELAFRALLRGPCGIVRRAIAGDYVPREWTCSWVSSLPVSVAWRHAPPKSGAFSLAIS